MIKIATAAAFANSVVNHPAVRPWVADLGEGELDLAALIHNPLKNSLVLQGEYGVFIVFRYFEGCYEVHTAVLPDGRGSWSRDFAEAGARYMFAATDCIEILTRVPDGHVGAETLTRYMGFDHLFTTLPEHLFRGERVAVKIFSLTLQTWMRRLTWAERDGAEFHDWLNKEVKEHGEPHSYDAGHNRQVGVTLDMIRNGQAKKGVIWYNRHAYACRHLQIRLLSENPPAVAFDAGVLDMADGKLRWSAKQ